MFASIAQPIARFAVPAMRQGARDAIHALTTVVIIYGSVAAVGLVGYGSYLGLTRSYRGARKTAEWMGDKWPRDNGVPIVSPMAPAAAPASPAEPPIINGTAEEVTAV